MATAPSYSDFNTCEDKRSIHFLLLWLQILGVEERSRNVHEVSAFTLEFMKHISLINGYMPK